MNPEGTSKKARVISFLPNGAYYFEKGIAAYQRGDLQRAKKFVERAMVFNPNDPDYLCQLAAILAELEQFDQSNRLLKKVIFELDPGVVECFFFMANNYAYLGRYEEAFREVKRYLSLEPNGPFADEARELHRLLVFETGTELIEEEAYLSDHEKGRQALESGEYKKAIYYFQKVIKERPDFWAAQNNLAIAYYSSGNEEAGLNQLDTILDNDPGNIHALCNKATFYHQIGNQNGLNELVPILNNLYPLYPESRSKLGATYFFLGLYEKAYHWLESAERTGFFEDQSFYYWLAVTCYKLGKNERALKAWEKVGFFSDTPFEPFEYGKMKELVEADDAPKNPLVHSLLVHELKEGKQDAKILSLFLCHSYEDAEFLKKAADGFDHTKEIRAIAGALYHHLEGDLVDPRIDVMLTLQDMLGAAKPLISERELYLWWSSFFTKVEEKTFDVLSWAAAFEYRWAQTAKTIKVTQSEICQRYGISAYKLRRHLDLFEGLREMETD
ncbi:MAG TPA: tetratricopeptide repeat protein [Candidatus Angelobacter sp.]|nr:tetratricopeptide repeat protein [Candidatus Angelobacter sp.]